MRRLTIWVIAIFCLQALSAQNIIYVEQGASGTGIVSDPIGLQGALDIAVSNGMDDVLYLKEGEYTNTPYNLDLNAGDGLNLSLIGSWSSDYSSQSMDITTTALNGHSASRIMSIIGTGATAETIITMEYLTFKNGYGDSEHGAGLYIEGGNVLNEPNIHLIAEHMDFIDNITNNSGYGGALYSNCSFELFDCYFDGNVGYGGGAIYAVWYDINELQPREVVNSYFINNKNYGDNGSSIWSNCKEMRISDSGFRGMENGTSSGPGSCIWGNTGGKLIVDRCSFKDIRINYWGSAIHSFDGDMDISNSLFVDNKAGLLSGYGAISFYHFAGPDRDIDITNCTFVGNEGFNGTFASAIHYRGNGNDELYIYNCLFWDNGTNPVYSESGFSEIGYTLSEYAPLGFTTVNAVVNDDPMLDAEYQFGAGSPCVDAGNQNFIDESWTDLDDGIRVLGDNVDYGCFEYNAPPMSIALNTQEIDENSPENYLVTQLAATGQSGDVHVFELVTGNGSNDADNASFYINGEMLYLSPSPDFEDQESYYINMKVIDSEDQWAEEAYVITVNDINEAPEFVGPLEDQDGSVGAYLEFTVNSNVFEDQDDGDTKTFSSTLEDGNALPTWLTFDANTRTYSGTPVEEDLLSIKLTVTDQGGLSAFGIFDLTIVVTGVEMLENLGGSVYPNPATDLIYLNIPIDGDWDYLISDAKGAIVLTGDISETQPVIRINKLMSGTYFITLYEDNRKVVVPFIKK